MSGPVTTAKRVAVYARASTADQDPETQLRELRELAARRGWSVHEEYVDHGISGAKDRRPALDELMIAAKQRKVDLVLVWALDRLGRSLAHLVRLVDEFNALGIDLVVHTQPVDTTTPVGRLTFSVIGAVAEFERALVIERVRAGVRRARAQGKRLGRPPRPVNVDAARDRLAAGRTLTSVASELGVSRRTLRRALARAEVGEMGAGSDEESVL